MGGGSVRWVYAGGDGPVHMTALELDQLLSSENNKVDWKSSGDPEKIVKTLTAYANDFEEAGYGMVICGVEESKDNLPHPLVTGLPQGVLKTLRDRVFNLCRSAVTPPLAPQFRTVTLPDANEVLVIWIGASSDIHACKGDEFVRLGDKVTKASPSQLAELALRKSHLDWLARPCPDARVDDLDLFALEELARRLHLEGGPSSFLTPGNRVIGSAAPFTSLVQTPTGTVTVPTRFAILLAGKEPHHFLPGAYVSLTRFAGTSRSDTVFYPGDLFGPIPFLVRKVMDALEAETGWVTDKSQDAVRVGQNRRRYSQTALQELVVNALAHRDYRDAHSTRVNIFSDRIEIENPGGAPNVSLAALRNGITNWRNPSMARYLFELGLAQEKGTGIPKAIKETLATAGGEPEFAITDWFKVTIPVYQPPKVRTLMEPVNHGSGVLVISVGYGTIAIETVRRSHQAFRDIVDDRVHEFSHEGVLAGFQWNDVATQVRDWVRQYCESPTYRELHLFYRGPVAFGPLIGAVAVGRKPMVVYYYDEEEGIYNSAYRIDRKFLQGE